MVTTYLSKLGEKPDFMIDLEGSNFSAVREKQTKNKICIHIYKLEKLNPLLTHLESLKQLFTIFYLQTVESSHFSSDWDWAS